MRLSTDELRRVLKEQLDDPTVAEITDERLLVRGILDPLLEESSQYAERYRSRVQEVVLRVYQEVKRGKRSRVPTGFWEREQGLLNLGIVLRPIIARQGWSTDRTIFQQFSTEWLEQYGLRLKKHNLYRSLVATYPEYAFDQESPTSFHIHPWDTGKCLWSNLLIKEAVRHTVHFHMPQGLNMRELLERFTLDFLAQEGLAGVVREKFNNSPYRLFMHGFPELIFDPEDPTSPHIHPWDASQLIWSDDLIREAARHMVKYHTDWRDEDLATKVTIPWLREVGLGGGPTHRFNDSVLCLIKFVYPELFEGGILSEAEFRHLRLGIGVSRFRQPLRRIPKSGYISIENRRYRFLGRAEYLNKISSEYGALYASDKSVIGLFRWHTERIEKYAFKYITIGQEDVEPAPREVTQLRRHLTFADAVRMLADEVRIVVHDLPLADQTALTDALNTVEPARVIDYLKLTGVTGLRAMADTEFSAALVLAHELFDPVEFRQVLDQYNQINAVLVEVSSLFTRHAGTIPQAKREEFRTELNVKFFAANNRIINALSQALIHRDRTTRDTLIADVLQAQRDMAAIVGVLDAFGQGALRLVRRRTALDVILLQYIYSYSGGYLTTRMDVYLVLRPRQNPQGQARIGFRIVPYLPVEAGLSDELSLRWDRETTTQTAIDIHSDAFVRLSRLDRRQFPRGYHYPLIGSQFADAMFVEQIVRSFLPS